MLYQICSLRSPGKLAKGVTIQGVYLEAKNSYGDSLLIVQRYHQKEYQVERQWYLEAVLKVRMQPWKGTFQY